MQILRHKAVLACVRALSILSISEWPLAGPVVQTVTRYTVDVSSAYVSDKLMTCIAVVTRQLSAPAGAVAHGTLDVRQERF